MGAEQRTDLAKSYLTRKGEACVSSYAVISCKDRVYSTVRCSAMEKMLKETNSRLSYEIQVLQAFADMHEEEASRTLGVHESRNDEKFE